MFSHFLRNKKGEKLLSIYWFLILIIVAGGIVAMTSIFYGSKYDVRDKEAESLALKVSGCIYEGGKMNGLLMSPQGVFRDDFKDKFLERCSLNLSSGKDLISDYYYVGVNFYRAGDLKNSKFFIEKGNLNWVSDCGLDIDDKGNLAQCFRDEFYLKDSKGNLYLAKILSIVGKSNENL